MPTPKKVQEVEALKAQLRQSPMGILTDYRGLTVSDLAALRRQLREAGGSYHVVKNTLLQIAAKETGVEGLEPMLEGPTAIAFSDHRLSELAKAALDFSKQGRPFAIKGGYLNGRAMTAADVDRLASLPPREQLLAQVVGGLQAPIAGLVGVLNATLSSLVYVLDARRRQLGSEAPAS